VPAQRNPAVNVEFGTTAVVRQPNRIRIDLGATLRAGAAAAPARQRVAGVAARTAGHRGAGTTGVVAAP
jgi:hypothetical protein